MASWLRFEASGTTRFGTLADGLITEYAGELFGANTPTGRQFPLPDVHLLQPCIPSKMPGLWNNFRARSALEGLHEPQHPLYFLKPSNSFAGHGAQIRRPAGYGGVVVFEGELGIVVGKRGAGISVEDAPAHIFGYTCVNDVTARELLKCDPAFVHWTRAKGFDTFGVFGPCITTGLDPAELRVRVELNGVEQQNYPVSDMFFSPDEIVSRLSHDMTLEAGDVIACGTSVGVCAMQDGDRVEVIIDGIGTLGNRFG